MNAVALYARRSADFEDKLQETRELLRQAAQRFDPLVQASSLGAEDMVLTHLLHQLGLKLRTFVLDTGQLHPQTLALIDQVASRYALSIDRYQPQPEAVQAFEQAHGPEAMYRSVELRRACCSLRKLEPLARALQGQRGWITGLRREQSSARAEVAFIEADGPDRHKINPLARWTAGDVWHFIGQEGVPYNALHDQFFPSIGCAPCTRAVTLGEDIRSGRWWWEQSSKECGLHVQADPAPALQEARP